MTTETYQSLPQACPVADTEVAPAAHVDAGLSQRRSRVLFAGLASGALLWLCYFPVAWGWLAWIALVPLLLLVRAETTRWRIYLSAWSGGLLFFWSALQWLRVADDRMYYTWAALATYCSVYFPVAVLLLRVLDRKTRLPLVVTLPAVWTGLEFVRAYVMTGFPWYFLGHTQHDFLHVVQIADLGGAYAVTFLVAMVNALVFEWLCAAAWFRRLLALPETARLAPRAVLVIQTLALFALAGAVLGYGSYRLGQDQFEDGPTVALVQSNLDQRIKVMASIDSTGGAAQTILNHNLRLSDLASVQAPRPELIVWPETSYPDDWSELAPGATMAELSPEERRAVDFSRDTANLIARRWRTSVLLGLNGDVFGGDRPRQYNSALLVQPDGRTGGRYDKMHRVPFGEYVPLLDLFPWMQEFAPYDYEYSVVAGESFTRFPLGGHHFGVVICYEDTVPTLARQYAGGNGQPPVDFLVNISNDGWFDGTSEHEEHLAICRFRAIECRLAVLRSVNMGVSAVIDGNGRVLAPQKGGTQGLDEEWTIKASSGGESLPVSQWGQYKQVAGVLTAVVPIDGRSSLYARWGDWLPWACWFLIGLGMVQAIAGVGVARRRPGEIVGASVGA